MLDTALLATLTTRAQIRDPSEYSDPRPGLTDVEWRQWLQLRNSLSTGSGIRRKPLRKATVQATFETADRAPDLRIHLARDERMNVDEDRLLPLLSQSPARYRTIEVPGPSVDEYGDPIPEHPGEIDMDHYRRVQRARQVLDTKSRYVQGWRPAVEYVPLFGHDRFHKFSQEPYFEDRCGFLGYVNATATRHNTYTLER